MSEAGGRMGRMASWARNMASTLLTSEGRGGKAAAVDKAELTLRLRRTDLFAELDDARLRGVISRMSTVDCKAGDVLVREGDEGDYYYVLVEGEAMVERRLPTADKTCVVARLTAGSVFGEEALISNAKRNATVTMNTDGKLMRLSRAEFNEHIKEPMVTWVSPVEAVRKVKSGGKWLDVREEVGGGSVARLGGSLCLPLSRIREAAESLDKHTPYVCYCDNGRLSSTAAFVLRQRAFDVAVLRGGLLALRRAGML